MAPFDTQKLKADINGLKHPEGTDYQHGESEGFDNIKAYVKWRDGYKCAVCGAEHVPLQVHHKKQRKDGGTDKDYAGRFFYGYHALGCMGQIKRTWHTAPHDIRV